jgi:hypothetical protein
MTGCRTYLSFQGATSLYCPTTSTCRIAYAPSTAATLATFNNLLIGICTNSACTAGTTTTADNGEEAITVELISAAGTPVDNAMITYQPDYSPAGYSYVRLRSAVPLTLADGTNYTVRIRSSHAQTTAKLVSAKLIVLQDNGGGISDTQSSVELGSSQTTTATSYGMLTSPKIYYYDTDNFSGTITTYFEASLKGSSGGVTAYAALSADPSCASTVSGSEVSVTGTTWNVARSSAITLPTDKEYFTCFKTSSGTGSMANAKLLINLSGSLDRVQTVQQLQPYAATDADTSYTTQSPINRTTKSNYAGDDAFYYLETVMKSSAGTGYAQLYNLGTPAAVTGSELSTTSTAFTRSYTANLESNLDPDQDYAIQIKNSATNTTTLANAWLVAQVSLDEAAQNAPPQQGPTLEQLLRGGRWWSEEDGLQPFSFINPQ